MANHLDQSLCLANQKQGIPVRSYLLHSSLAGAPRACPNGLAKGILTWQNPLYIVLTLAHKNPM